MARPYRNRRKRKSRRVDTPGIRYLSSYGRHGFAPIVDAIAEEWSYDSNEFCTDDCGGSSAWLVDNLGTRHDIATYKSHEYGYLNRKERRFFRDKVGAIVCIDSQGFVTVAWYATEEKMREDWDEIYESFYPESEDSEDTE